jgi:hypothetical protein
LVDDEQPEEQEDHEREDVGEDREPAATPLALDLDVHLATGLVLVSQQRDERLLGVVRVGRLVLLLVLVDGVDVERVVLGVDRDRLDLALVHVGEELRVGRDLLAIARADQLLGEERQHHHDEDRECCALEESAHE